MATKSECFWAVVDDIKREFISNEGWLVVLQDIKMIFIGALHVVFGVGVAAIPFVLFGGTEATSLGKTGIVISWGVELCGFALWYAMKKKCKLLEALEMKDLVDRGF